MVAYMKVECTWDRCTQSGKLDTHRLVSFREVISSQNDRRVRRHGSLMHYSSTTACNMYSVDTKSFQAKENILMAEQAKGAGDVIIQLFEVSDWLIVFLCVEFVSLCVLV